MDWSSIITLVVGVVFGGGFLTFLQFMIKRSDEKKAKAKEDPIVALNARMDKLEKGIADLRHESDLGDCRTQMLILMEHNPNDKTRMLQIAEHYFKDLGGDWYMSSRFADWAKDFAVPLPKWFHDDTN